MAKRYYWLKLKKDFFSETAIKRLRRIAGGDTFTVIYLKLLLLALGQDGVLQFEGIDDTFADELALILDEDADNVKVTLNFLANSGLIEEIDKETIFLTKLPDMVGSESESAKRVQKHRARKKSLELQGEERLLPQDEALQCNGKALHRNTDVTKCNKNVTIEKRDKRKEIEKEIDIISPLNPPKGRNALEEIVDQLPTETQDAVRSFIEMRKLIKAPVTVTALKSLITKAKKYSNGDTEIFAKIFIQSTERSWRGVFPLSEEKKTFKDMLVEEIQKQDTPKLKEVPMIDAPF